MAIEIISLLIKYVKKKIGNQYIVWFDQSNQWIQLEEPAYFVFAQYKKGKNVQTISSKYSRKYGLSREESLRVVSQLCKRFDKSAEPVNIPIDKVNPLEFHLKPEDNFFVSRHYRIAEKIFRIDFTTRLSEYYIHPPLAHLETQIGAYEICHHFQIFDNEELVVLKDKEQIESAWGYDDFMKLKKRLYICIANSLFKKSTDDWLAFVHAAAITNGKKTLLISSPSGSGKSTMAALLNSKGYKVLSDDFIPINAKPILACPFPAAIAVKPGAFEILKAYYDKLNDFYYNQTSIGKVHYIPTFNSAISDLTARPVKEIVFLKYDAKVVCDFKKISTTEALKKFHDQSWVSPAKQHAQNFINWFAELQCYSLVYSHIEKGIEKISGLL